MPRYSHSIGNGIAAIGTYLDMDTDLEVWKDGQPTEVGRFIDGLFESSKQLYLTSHITDLATRLGGATNFRKVLNSLIEHDDFFEHLAAALGLEALYRAENGMDRLVPLLELLPMAAPPEVTKRYLQGAATCYLLQLDDQCIVMCRGAIETIVEDLDPTLENERLGEAIGRLADRNRVSHSQAADMREVNRQAREVLHRTPHRRPPDAGECLRILARLLSQLHPAVA